jgi:hypothetical protein
MNKVGECYLPSIVPRQYFSFIFIEKSGSTLYSIKTAIAITWSYELTLPHLIWCYAVSSTTSYCQVYEPDRAPIPPPNLARFLILILIISFTPFRNDLQLIVLNF